MNPFLERDTKKRAKIRAGEEKESANTRLGVIIKRYPCAIRVGGIGKRGLETEE